MISTVEGVSQANAIAAVPGIHALAIDTMNLQSEAGYPAGSADYSKLEQAIHGAARTSRKYVCTTDRLRSPTRSHARKRIDRVHSAWAMKAASGILRLGSRAKDGRPSATSFATARTRTILGLGFYSGRESFVHGEHPDFIRRFHLQVKRPRILADIGHTVALPFAVNHGLHGTAADRASQNELEPSLAGFGLATRFPRKPEVSARAGERLGRQVPAARPRANVLPDNRRL
jgi:hypothetical protein